MDKESLFLKRWEEEEPAHAAWGEYVTAKILDEISNQISPVAVNEYIKIPVHPRVKQTKSLIEKAFHRGKGYVEPFDEIEDKVGIRIVVLTTDDIREIENIICNSEEWSAVKARDFEEERRLKPLVFDYQSVHYVIRALEDICHEGVQIKKNIPCEVQIRTILQHAYSELTHDTIYKPSITVEPEMQRSAAKSMALIEATDDYFLSLQKYIKAAIAPAQNARVFLNEKYLELIGHEGDDDRLNAMIIDRYSSFTIENFEQNMTEFLNTKPYIADRIKERRDSFIVFRQTAILLVYYAVHTSPLAASGNETPLSEEELSPIYSDLGENPPWV